MKIDEFFSIFASDKARDEDLFDALKAVSENERINPFSNFVNVDWGAWPPFVDEPAG